MIVNYTSLGWEIVSQRAHGLLAAGIANAWQHKIRTERWVEVLIAIAEHDDAQIELERTDLLTDQGGPVDFAMRKMEYAHCLDTMTRAYNKSTCIAFINAPAIFMQWWCRRGYIKIHQGAENPAK
jgi:hypothetical protein